MKSNKFCLSSKFSSSQLMIIKTSKSLARGKRDILTGRRRNKAHKISFSNKKSRKWQGVNIRRKKLYWHAGERFVQLRISARTIRTVDRKGLDTLAKGFGINLWKLPFKDMRQKRLEYLATRPIE